MKKNSICSFLCFLPFFCCAQEKGRENWFLPDILTSQYAGSIGLISVGAGYEVIKRKANVELLVGYLPSFTGSKSMQTLTLKFTARPVLWRPNNELIIEPMTMGIYFCYTPGREYSSDLPSWYPDGYYWWSEAVRVNIFIGGSVVVSLGQATEKGRRLSGYYEIGTNEIKLVSYVQNKDALSIWNILHASLGVRYFFDE